MPCPYCMSKATHEIDYAEMQNGVFFVLSMMKSNDKRRLKGSCIRFQSPENFWMANMFRTF